MILRRLEGSRFSEVLPAWPGETVVILGGGPSLTMEQVRTVQAAHGRVRCIAVNDCYLVASWADVQYSADAHWHRWHSAGIPKPMLWLDAGQVREMWAAFAGQKCTIENSGGTVADDRVHMLKIAGEQGLSLDPKRLVTGRNSGFQALNMAILAGAKKVLLLGFDGQSSAGVSHFHGGHPRPTPEAAYPLQRQAMRDAATAIRRAGVEVINCSPGSAIDTFPKMEIGRAL